MKYILVPVSALQQTVLPPSPEKAEIFDQTVETLAELSAGDTIPLNAQDLMVDLSIRVKTLALETGADKTPEDKLNEKNIKFLWPIVQGELEAAGVL